MTLFETQQEFARCAHQLEGFILSNGWTFTKGDDYRDPRVHGEWGIKKGYGSSHSVHKLKLATDRNLVVNGKYITDGSCDEYKLLGDYWKASHKLARWGGDFPGDANHFSFEHNGFK